MGYGMTDDFIDMRDERDAARDERDAAHRELATLKAALAESDIRIAGVEAERDHYRVGLAESERARADAVRERDALKAGKWAGPWHVPKDGADTCVLARKALSGVLVLEIHMSTEGLWVPCLRRYFKLPTTMAEVQDVCDKHGAAAGWYLAKSEEG